MEGGIVMIPMFYTFYNAKVEEQKGFEYSVLAPCSLIEKAYELLENK